MFGLNLFNRKSFADKPKPVDLAQRAGSFTFVTKREKTGSALKNDDAMLSFMGDYGYYERITLYRFIRDNIPVINGAIWTWTRLCSSPLEFYIPDNESKKDLKILNDSVSILNERLASDDYRKSGGIERLSDLLFHSLFTDGAFAGEIEFSRGKGITRFIPSDVRRLSFEKDSNSSSTWRIFRETEDGKTLMDPALFIYIPLDDDPVDPRGKSILQSVGFVSRMEQKLLYDMQQTQEKAGYNRVHVKIKKPERRMGESEDNFLDRANRYFDDTVTLFSGIKPADSVVTWDDIEIETIAPRGGNTTSTNSWYLSHRSLVEDICAGVHLDPFMLGYSYGNTRSWARFKFELVLRQVVSVQKFAVRFFEWLVNTHLSKSGINLKAAVRFNNDRINGALARYESEREACTRIIELYNAGLIDKDEARNRIFRIESEN
jgi:hypothetical protein